MVNIATEMKTDPRIVLDAKTYSIAEVSRLTGLHAKRVARWLQGYSYSYKVQSEGVRFREQEPVIQREATKGTTYASFLDLIDLLFVKQFMDRGLSLQKIRVALNEATELLDTHHFAREIFFTDGHNIYIRIMESGPEKNEGILQLMSGGQWAIAPVIEDLATRIDFQEATGFARRWYPLGQNELIVVDPMISFGRPSIVNRGVATANIYDFYLGEEQNLEQVCHWLDLKPQEVKAAVTFEQQLAA